MKKLLTLVMFVLLASCGGNRSEIQIARLAEGEYLIIDRNCTAIMRREQARRGSRKNRYVIRESDGFCHVTNITLREHMSDTYGMEGTFEEGERVFIWAEDDMEKLMRYLIKNGLSIGEE